MDNFSPEALEILYASKIIAHQSGSSCVELLQVFQGLLREDAGDVVPLLAPARRGLSAAFRLIGKKTDAAVPGGMEIFAFPLSPDVMELCTRAQGLASRWHHGKVGNVHLLHSLMGMECPELLPVLEDFGLDPYRIMAQCVVILKRMPPSALPGSSEPTVKYVTKDPEPPWARSLEEVEKELFRVRRDKEKAIRDKEFEKAAALREQETKLSEKIREIQMTSSNSWRAFSAAELRQAPASSTPAALPPVSGGASYVQNWISQREKTPGAREVSTTLPISGNPDDWMDEDVISVLEMATDLSRINESAIHLDHLVLALIEGDLSGSMLESFRSVLDPEELKNRLKTNLQTGEYPANWRIST